MDQGITTQLNPNVSILQEDTPKRRFKLSTVAAILIGTVLGIPLMLVGFFTLQGAFLTRASDSAPRDVVISDVDFNAATVTWTTDQETQGTIQYGGSPDRLTLVAPELGLARDHTVVMTGLLEGTDYYFKIKIGDTIFDNGGEAWKLTTNSTTARPTAAAPTSNPNSTCIKTTDCLAIQKLIGKTCTTAEYLQCLRANSAATVSAAPTAGEPTPVIRYMALAASSATAVRITWNTNLETQGTIEYGLTPDQINQFVQETTKGSGHSVDITGLQPATTYYYRLRIGNNTYLNGGVPWTFTTRAQ